MLPYQERVVREASELEEKLDKLRSFIGAKTFASLSGEEQGLLMMQRRMMADYLDVLQRRIALFK